MLAFGCVALAGAALTGEVRLGVGDMEIVAGPGDGAVLRMEVHAEAAPPDRGWVELGWRPQATVDGTLSLDAKLPTA